MTGTDPRHLADLTEAQRDQAMARWQVLRPHLEDGVPLARLAGHGGVGCRTLQRWAARYRADGLAGLARRERADRGARQFPDKLQLLIEGLALKRPPPAIATIHRDVTAVARQHGWPVLSYATVHDVVRHLDPALVVLAQEGTRRYEELFELVYRREASKPNEIWQADHTELDLWVVTPAGQPARPWLTIIEDDYSRAVAGYGLNLGAPSALTDRAGVAAGDLAQGQPGWHVCGIPAASTSTMALISPPGTWSR